MLEPIKQPVNLPVWVGVGGIMVGGAPPLLGDEQHQI